MTIQSYGGTAELDTPPTFDAAGYCAVTPADLGPGTSRCVEAGGTGIIVARARDGQYYAIQRQCSHAAMLLDGGKIRGSSIVCPHHGARFDLKTGKVLGAPATAPIAAWPAREVDGQVEVRIAT